MICKNCGTVIDDQADVCFTCGCPVPPLPEGGAPVYELSDPAYAASSELAVYPAAPVEYMPPKAGAFARVVSFLFALIGYIIFLVKKRNGQDAQAVSVADAIVAGFCAKMIVGIGYLIYLFMLSPIFQS